MRILKLFFVFLLVFLISCSIPENTVFLQVNNTCNVKDLGYSQENVLVQADNFYILLVSVTESDLENLLNQSCVIRSVPEDKLSTFLENIKQDLDVERDVMIRKNHLNRTLKKDVLDKDKLDEFLKKQTQNTTVALPYQLFVTPEAKTVKSLSSSLNGMQEIYTESLHWVWISDELLFGEDEQWLYPSEFLKNTANYPTNPTGKTASDCEEQANALASVLIANGYSSENIRVVLGLVDFDGTVGGHAWVQVYENNNWLDIEATMGDYYDESTGEIILLRSDISYTYFKYHEYPSKEIWYYYNHEYYLIPNKKGNAPSHWLERSKTQLEDDLKNRAK